MSLMSGDMFDSVADEVGGSKPQQKQTLVGQAKDLLKNGIAEFSDKSVDDVLNITENPDGSISVSKKGDSENNFWLTGVKIHLINHGFTVQGMESVEKALKEPGM